MILSHKGFDFIAAHEGCKLHAYQDQAGIWTIGFGCTYHVRPGEVWTYQQALAALSWAISKVDSDVNRLVKSATQDQYDAMISLTYNIGVGAFHRSSVLRAHLAGQFDAAADAFLLWDKVRIDDHLTFDQGLLNRRRAERDLYLMLSPLT